MICNHIVDIEYANMTLEKQNTIFCNTIIRQQVIIFKKTRS